MILKRIICDYCLMNFLRRILQSRRKKNKHEKLILKKLGIAGMESLL